jgi:hypothetical protein
VKRVVASVASVAALASCASASIEGGALAAKGGEPAGVTIGRWRVSRCLDSKGAPLPYGDARVSVVRMTDGRVLLVLMQDGADSVVVRNVSRAGEGWVFALALGRVSGNRDLYEYSVPKDGGGDGRFVIARQWKARDTEQGFIGTYAKASVTCALVLEAVQS